jgi:hypothetical protein
MTTPSNYERATKETAENLHKVTRDLAQKRLTKLTLPELDSVVELVSKIVPAGNVPGLLLSSLARIKGNRIQPEKARQDINILFREAQLIYEQAKYEAIFATPARVIWAYQRMLRLLGKDMDSAFPEGVWQFYVEYALREDTARHTNETNGFDVLLNKNDIQLTDIDRLTAWVMAAVTTLHQYKSLLASEWYERSALWLLQETAEMENLHAKWDKQKPYARANDGGGYDYPAYRRLKFDQFLKQITSKMPHSKLQKWEQQVKESVDNVLESYQKQMSILAYLEPSPFGETRIPYSLENAYVGIIHNGNYHLLPICEPRTSNPLDVRTARSQIVNILSLTPREPAKLKNIARIRRAEFSVLREKLSPDAQEDLNKLRHAPILINNDRHIKGILLSDIRLRERGVGDHPLTIFDTGGTFAFDQSHIFFDGAWGAALAEIMTNEALSWAAYLNLLSPAPAGRDKICVDLQFAFNESDTQLIENAPIVPEEAGAENEEVNVRACLELKRYFNQRSDLLKLTINDLLVLYRAIHADTYRPSEKLQHELDALEKINPQVAKLVREISTVSANTNPSILIPVDAGRHIPRDRIYPFNIEVPLIDLDLLNLHKQTLQALTEYKGSKRGKKQYAHFTELQRRYLATLGGFGTILARAKQIAVLGESASVGAIKLLAHLPPPLKQLLDKVPAHYEKLNNIIKGTEVISNLGAVARSSSLTRFMTATDDNEQKQLTWGVLTDAKGIMKITLRDFRPHVAALHAIRRKDIADLIAQDYLDTYAQGLNQYVQEVTQIAVAHSSSSKQ